MKVFFYQLFILLTTHLRKDDSKNLHNDEVSSNLYKILGANQQSFLFHEKNINQLIFKIKLTKELKIVRLNKSKVIKKNINNR